MTQVRCNVSSCHYWGSSDVCEASEIKVKNNFAGGSGMGANMEIGEIGSNDEAGTSRETMCETYKPTDKDKALHAESKKNQYKSGK